MYMRLYRWAADRVGDERLIAFISDRSFLDAQNMDGFRRATQNEFSAAWIVDLGGDVRSDPRLSGTKHNVFGIQTGVSICLLVKRKRHTSFSLHYARRPQAETAEEKLSFLSSTHMGNIEFEQLRTQENGDWLHQRQTDFGALMPLAEMPGGRNKSRGYLFALSSTGIMSGRDEWVYDFCSDTQSSKMEWFASRFRKVPSKADVRDLPRDIKWSETLKRLIGKVPLSDLNTISTRSSTFRPFVKKAMSKASYLIDRPGALEAAFIGPNQAITFLV